MSVSMHLGVSYQRDTRRAVAESIQKALQGNLRRPDIVCLFVAGHEGEAVAQSARETGLPVCGASAKFLITREGTCGFGIAAVGISVEGVFNGPVLAPAPERVTSSARSLAADLKKGFGPGLHRFAMLLGCSSRDAVESLYDALGADMPFAGGRTGCAPGREEFVFAGSQVVPQGALMLSFATSAPFETGVEHGWKPIGRPALVTSCTNRGLELDGRPAYETYCEILRSEVPGVSVEEAALNDYVMFPLGVPTFGGVYLTKDPRFETDADGSIVSRAVFPEGALVRLMQGTAAGLEGAARTCIDTAVAAGIPTGILGISCECRYTVYGMSYDNEVRALVAALPDQTPFLLLPGWGEYGPYGHGPITFLNKAFVLMALPGGDRS